MRFGTHDRDAGLRRVSRLTRWMVAGSVALAGGLSAVVAHALPGSSSTGSSTNSTGVTNDSSPSGVNVTPDVPATGDDGVQPAPPPVRTHHDPVVTSGGS